jgi:hypothetical protein
MQSRIVAMPSLLMNGSRPPIVATAVRRVTFVQHAHYTLRMSNQARLFLVGETQGKVVSNVPSGHLLEVVMVPQNWTSLLGRITQVQSSPLSLK